MFLSLTTVEVELLLGHMELDLICLASHVFNFHLGFLNTSLWKSKTNVWVFSTNIIKRDRLEKTYRWVTRGFAQRWDQDMKQIPLIAAIDGSGREQGL